MKSMTYKIIMMALALTAGSLVRAAMMDTKHSCAAWAAVSAQDMASSGGGFASNFVGAMEQDRNLAALASTAVVDTLFKGGVTSTATAGGSLDYVVDGYRHQIKKSPGLTEITISSPSVWNKLKHQTGRFFNRLYNTAANAARYVRRSSFAKATAACVATLAFLYAARSTGATLPVLGLGSMSIHRA